MKRLSFGLLALLGLTFGAANAQTITSVTQYSYDADERPTCTAVRMDPTTYGSLPANACALTSTGGGAYGVDRVTQTTYDAAGQVLETDQAVGTSIQRAYGRYTYNADGIKTTETDAIGNTTTYVYDGFNRLSQLQYPSPATPATGTVGASNANDYEQFQYDADGNKTVWRRRNGKTLYYNYDAQNHEILRYVSDGSVPNVYSDYNLLGQPCVIAYTSDVHAAGPDCTSLFGSLASTQGIHYEYDGLGRLHSTQDMNGRQISYAYDAASNRTQLTYPDGNWQPYTYDADNRVTTSGLGSGNYYISYDGLGHVIAVARGISAAAGAVNYGYDQIGRLTSEAQTLAGTADNVTWNWTFNPADQIISTAASSTAYDYVETASTTVANTYDGLNRDAALALTSAACPSGGYDGNGNLICDGTRTFTYDVYNHLVSETSGGNSLSLVYDPLGRLASQTYNGVVTSFLYDGTNLISEYDNSGNVAERYVFGPGTDQPIIWFQGSQNTTPLYFVQDYHGSVIGYTDASGNLQDMYKYGPYGEPKNAGNWTSFAGARFRYTGQMVIPEASLYYYKARVYDPIFGRFLQTDPIGSKDDLDLYAYVGDDPTDKTDPTGLYDPTNWVRGVTNGTGEEISIPTVSEGVGFIAAAGTVIKMASVAGAIAYYVTPTPTASPQQDQLVGKGFNNITAGRNGDFTKADKAAKYADNMEKNDGNITCEKCGRNDLQRVQSQKGVSTPDNAAAIHHDPPIHQGGGRDSKPIVVCPTCHKEEHKTQ